MRDSKKLSPEILDFVENRKSGLGTYFVRREVYRGASDATGNAATREYSAAEGPARMQAPKHWSDEHRFNTATQCMILMLLHHGLSKCCK
jgi:hypothetical protein